MPDIAACAQLSTTVLYKSLTAAQYQLPHTDNGAWRLFESCPLEYPVQHSGDDFLVARLFDKDMPHLGKRDQLFISRLHSMDTP